MDQDRKPQSINSAFDHAANPDSSPLRDKDNADPKLKPNYSQRPAPNLAPGGAMGIRPRSRNYLVPQNDNASNTHAAFHQGNPLVPSIITVESVIDADTHKYVTGHFVSVPKIDFMTRVSNDPNHKGINGSSVEQLVIKQEGKVLARYNMIAKDADKPAQTPEQRKLVERVCSSMDKMQGRERTNLAQQIGQDRSDPPKHERIVFRKLDRGDHQTSDQQEKSKSPRDRIQFRKSKNVLIPGHGTSKSELALDTQKNEISPWISGEITTMPGYSFHAKVFDQPSEYGIDNGTISKLQITKDGEQVASFDRGWDQEPETAEHKEALHRIRDGLGDTSRKTITAEQQSPDKNHGWER